MNMTTIRRQRPPKHILVPDTEVLWHEEKDVAVAPEITEFWNDYGDKYEIELVIPKVVFGELIYQHTTSALTALNRANKQFKRLSKIADSEYRHKISENKVRRDVERKLRTWVTQVGASVYETPITSIDWAAMIENALWRRAPFLEDRKIEKGFRDALILETICAISSGSPQPNTAFITGDVRLREGCDAKIASGVTFVTYESIGEFSSFLRLLDEELTSDFVTAIQGKARQKFYSDGNESCLLARDNLPTEILDRFSEAFEQPEESQSLGGLLTAAAHLTTKPQSLWQPISEDGVWIVAPTFVELSGTHDFIWESHILFIRMYEYTGQSTTLLSRSKGQKRLRKNDFKITWTARIDRAGRFRRMSVDNIELDSKSFESPSDDDIRRYNLDGDTAGAA